MKLAIMQPYFFPYIGYWSLIKQTDHFMIFDTPQFMRRGWIERNRILKQQGDWQYISVPLEKKPLDTPINQMVIRSNESWKEKIKNQLMHYKKKAPYFYKTMALVEQALNIETDSIVTLNVHVLKTICEYLNINFNYSLFSESNLDIAPVQTPDEWALNICKALGNVQEYWNPIGGLEFFDRQKYLDNNINIAFQKIELLPYSQGGICTNFEPGLSIIDILMFNDLPNIHKMLDTYELV